MTNSRLLAPKFSADQSPAVSTFDELQHEMNSLFGRFFHRDPFRTFNLPAQMKGFDLTPTVDVAEKDGAYEITAELPGIAEKDVAVTVDHGVLTISGEKKDEKNEEKKNVHISERRYGSFQRSFSLPDDSDEQKISADFNKGVLKITVGRAKQIKKNGTRQIAIKAA